MPLSLMDGLLAQADLATGFEHGGAGGYAWALGLCDTQPRPAPSGSTRR